MNENDIELPPGLAALKKKLEKENNQPTPKAEATSEPNQPSNQPPTQPIDLQHPCLFQPCKGTVTIPAPSISLFNDQSTSAMIVTHPVGGFCSKCHKYFGVILYINPQTGYPDISIVPLQPPANAPKILRPDFTAKNKPT